MEDIAVVHLNTREAYGIKDEIIVSREWIIKSKKEKLKDDLRIVRQSMIRLE